MKQHLLFYCTSGLALALSTPAAAQEAEPASDTATEFAPENVYEPSYFERFAPRNALDMVRQIPGFNLQGGGDGGRGLGQADENVLINGDRLTSKSDSARDQLGRIPASNVVRIEIVDGTTLDIPGLTGQVANIIIEQGGITGQFRWEGAVRTTEVDPEWYGGEISVSGSLGELDFTVAIENNNNRFGATGPIVFTDAAGAVIEDTQAVFTGAFDVPRISGAFGYDFGGDVTANLNLNYARSYFSRLVAETRDITGTGLVLRDDLRSGGTPEYEISGDITFPLGPGALKLIALDAYDEELSDSVIIDTVASSGTATGDRFVRSGGDGERIGRFEYSWPMLGGDWQLSGEAAFNRLERVSELFELAPDGNFTEIDFPEGSGGVTEDRYEFILAYSRQLTPKLALQAAAGGEYSQLKQTGSAANTRTFQRPKGNLSLAWRPQTGLDISVELLREVGQLSFGDFLANVSLGDNNQNAGNNQLVPQQSWGVDVEINKVLGEIGSTTLTLQQRWIEDYIDLIPLIAGGEARGNVPSARSTEISWNTTVQLDSLGISGGQLDWEVDLFLSSVRDQLTGENRAFSNAGDVDIEIDYRHDVPGTNFAYGAGLNYEHRQPSFRISETNLDFEGPTFANIFVEHKDVFGLTVRATYANLFGGRERTIRTVFNGPRTDEQIAFIEDRNLRIGPIFRFSVSGNF
ncbi:TonB-dependent receptor plug domain-containing protein [Pontixanthobacter rizhaonensis]|uniref:TonB-dependent receptor plug domain-containing protein n=1 Tax=Pontixanthobacter rizhaonensis TaxID=2730337 RepID=UPI001FE8A100|nr:TonB-dependent receptor plug domain-containing protein [Pontixanthobacter rizhaonensis]